MRIRTAAALCLLFLAACTPLASSLIESGGVLYQESFPDAASGWRQVTNEEGIQGYYEGGYRFLVLSADHSLWAVAGLRLGDVRVEADAVRLAGPEENRLGLICRFQDPAHYYFFAISSDGFYALGKVSGDRLALIGQEQWLRSDAIRLGGEINHLRADCVGSSLAFYVNGVPVAVGEDGEYASGDAGLLAGAFAATGVDVLFDNFVIYKP